MSAVEEIEAAIEKLETLKAHSVPGPWKHWPEAGDIEIYTDAPNPRSASSEYIVAAQVRPRNDFGGKIYVDNYEPNAELIVTLHSTIEAQLAILRAALSEIHDTETDPTATYSDGRHMSGERMLKVTALGRASLELARAINGATS